MHSPAASNYEYAAKAAKNRCFPLVEWAAGGQERVGTVGEIEEGEERKGGRDRECILCLARSQARRRTIWGHFTLIWGIAHISFSQGESFKMMIADVLPVLSKCRRVWQSERA